MTALSMFLARIPVWVLPLFVLLLWLGVRARNARSMPMSRVLIAPIAFLLWGMARLIDRVAMQPSLLAVWCLFAAAAGLAAMRLARVDRLAFDTDSRRVTVPGSNAPLIRYMAIFWAKFAIGVATGLLPEHRAALLAVDCAISGLMSGYFTANLVLILRAWRSALRSAA